MVSSVAVTTTPRLARLSQQHSVPDERVILVVEDTRSVREVLIAYLRQLRGFVIEAVESLSAVREFLDSNDRPIFCAVTNVNLPDSSDGEVIDVLREHDVPTIVLTASIDEKVCQHMIEKNIVDYVIKRTSMDLEGIAYFIGRLRENENHKIIVVDDSRGFLKYLVTILSRYFYKTLPASNGREALALLQENPDTALVLTDIRMPEMTGVELITEIRRNYRREDVAIIAISESHREVATLLKLGANDFIEKPFVLEEFYCRVTQNTNMVSYVRQIKNIATRDPLTGIFNRRQLFEAGQLLYESAKRGSITIATAMIDADHFKRINDYYGHDVGDSALKVIAAHLSDSLRKTDVVVRFGGEEFVAVAIIKEAEHAELLFERIRADIEAVELVANDELVTLTISCGVTTTLCATFEEMISRADLGVYEAKAKGRNQVVVM